MAHIIKLDSLNVQVIVDNEIDVMSYVSPDLVTTKRHFHQIGANSPHRILVGPNKEPTKEKLLEDICCAAHGLSVMLTGTHNGTKHSILIDAGPEGAVWEENAKRLGCDLSTIELIHLTHWHRDHSGGLIRAVELITAARREAGIADPVIVDLQPDRPEWRGVMTDGEPVSLRPDPTFAELEAAGAAVRKNRDAHAVLDEFFLVSGFIPLRAAYEIGAPNGITYKSDLGKWVKDEEIADERFVACRVKGKGVLIVTGCSHRGVINAVEEAMVCVGEGEPLHAVIGGFHLVARNAAIEETVRDFVRLDPHVLLPGHCSGWRVKFEIEKQLPGRLVPCSVGGVYQF